MADFLWWARHSVSASYTQLKIGDGFQLRTLGASEALCLTPLEGAEHSVRLLSESAAVPYAELTYFTLEIASVPAPADLDEESQRLEETVAERFAQESYGALVYPEDRYKLQHLSSRLHLSLRLEPDDHCEVLLTDLEGATSTLRIAASQPAARAAVEYTESVSLYFQLEGVNYYLAVSAESVLTVSTQPTLWNFRKVIDFATDVNSINPFIPVTFRHPELKLCLSVLEPVYWFEEGQANSRLALTRSQLGYESHWFLEQTQGVASISWGSQVYIRNTYTREYIFVGMEEALQLSFSAKTAFTLTPAKAQQTPQISNGSSVLLIHNGSYVAVGRSGWLQHLCSSLSVSKSAGSQGLELVLRRCDLSQLQSEFIVEASTLEQTRTYYQLLMDVTALKTVAASKTDPSSLLESLGGTLGSVLKSYLRRLDLASHSSLSRISFMQAVNSLGIPLVLMLLTKQISTLQTQSKEQVTHYVNLAGNTLRLLVQGSRACCQLVLRRAELLKDCFHYPWVADVLATALRQVETVPEVLRFPVLWEKLQEATGQSERSAMLLLACRLFKLRAVSAADLARMNALVGHSVLTNTLLVLGPGPVAMSLDSAASQPLAGLSSCDSKFLCRVLKLLSHFVRTSEYAPVLVTSPPFNQTPALLKSVCLGKDLSLTLRREALSFYLALEPHVKGNLASDLRLPSSAQKPPFLGELYLGLLEEAGLLGIEYEKSGSIFPTLKRLASLLKMLNLLLACDYPYPLRSGAMLLHSVLRGFDREAEGSALTNALQRANFGVAGHSSLVRKFLSAKPLRRIVTSLLPGADSLSPDLIAEQVEARLREAFAKGLKQVVDAHINGSEDMGKVLKVQKPTENLDWHQAERRKEVEVVIKAWLKDRIETAAAARRFRLASLCTRIAKYAIRGYHRLSLHYQRRLANTQTDVLEALHSADLGPELQLHYTNFWLVALSPVAASVVRPSMSEIFREAFHLQVAVSRRREAASLSLDLELCEKMERTDLRLRYAIRSPGSTNDEQALACLKTLLTFLPLGQMRQGGLQTVQRHWTGSGLHLTVVRLLETRGEEEGQLTHYCVLFLWAFVLNNEENLRTLSALIKPKVSLFRLPHYAEICIKMWKLRDQGWEDIYQALELLVQTHPHTLKLLELCFEGDLRGQKVLHQFCFVRALLTDPSRDLLYLTALAGAGVSHLSSCQALSEPDICSLLEKEDTDLPFAAVLVAVLREESGGELSESSFAILLRLWTRVEETLADTLSLAMLGLENCYECVAQQSCEVWGRQLQLSPPVAAALSAWNALFAFPFFWQSGGLVLDVCGLLGCEDENEVQTELRTRVEASLTTLEREVADIGRRFDCTPLQQVLAEARALLRGHSTSKGTAAAETAGRKTEVLGEVMRLDTKQGAGASDSEVALRLKAALYHTQPELYFRALRLRLQEMKSQAREIVFKEAGFAVAAETAVTCLSKATDPETRYEALLFLSSLLQALSPPMVQDFKSMLDLRGLSVLFAKHLLRELEGCIRYLRDQQSLLFDRMETSVQVLRLIQTCCEGCNEPLQDYFRTVGQPEFSLVNTCCSVLESLTNEGEGNSLVSAALKTLLELVSGPNEENQRLVALRPALLRSLAALLASSVQRETPLLQRCTDLLLGLVEGSAPHQAEIRQTLLTYFDLEPVLGYLNSQAGFLYTHQHELELGRTVPGSQATVSLMIRLFIFLLRLGAGTHLSELNPSVLSFLRKYTGHVEVLSAGKLEQTYFPLPFDAFYLTDHTKNLLVFESDRTSQQAQLIDFLNSVPALEAEMGYQQRLHRTHLKIMTSHWSGYGKVSFLFLLCVNVMVVFTFSKQDLLGETSPDSRVMTLLGTLQLLFFMMYTVCYIAEYFPRLIRDSKTTFAGLDYDSKDYQLRSESLALTLDAPQQVTTEEITTLDQVKYFCTGRTTIYCLCYIAGSVLAMQLPALYPFLLVDGLHRFEGLHHISKAITINKWHLSLSLLMIVVVVYQFTMVSFLTISHDYAADQGLYCDTLLSCLLTNLDMGVRNGGGIGNVLPTATPPNFWIRLLFDTLFYVVVIVILQNVSFGIIIDTYAELRDQEARLMEDVYASCFVCGVTRGKLEMRGESFLAHIKDQHSLFNYLCYVVYLKHKSCSGSEALIKTQIARFDTSFFPLDKEAE